MTNFIVNDFFIDLLFFPQNDFYEFWRVLWDVFKSGFFRSFYTNFDYSACLFNSDAILFDILRI